MSGGRPTALTPETQRIVLEALRSGAYISTACSIAGVNESTFYEWLKRGTAGESPFLEFSKAASIAIAQAEVETVAHIRKHGCKDWRALAWWLSRRHRKRWGSEVSTQAPAIQRNITVKTTRRGES